MYKSYDDYLESMEPKFSHRCPGCGREYFSNNGEDWFDDDRDEFYRDPVNGKTCVSCEVDEATKNPHHWASEEVLCTEDALLWVVKDAIRYSEDQKALIYRLFASMAADEECAESMKSYLDDHYTELRETVEYSL